MMIESYDMMKITFEYFCSDLFKPCVKNPLYVIVYEEITDFIRAGWQSKPKLYENSDSLYVIVDEVSRKYDKSSRTDTQFYAWLMQSRKRCRLVYLITQEFKELPMWLRRPLKRSYSTRPFLFFKNIFITTIGDAENMVLDKDTLEWTCPPISFIIYKRNKCITDLYDTFEPINQL